MSIVTKNQGTQNTTVTLFVISPSDYNQAITTGAAHLLQRKCQKTKEYSVTPPFPPGFECLKHWCPTSNTPWEELPGSNGLYFASRDCKITTSLFDLPTHRKIAICSPNNLNELANKVDLIRFKYGLTIDNMIFNGHGCPFGFQLTQHVIKIPQDPRFNDPFFTRFRSRAQCESLTQFVQIIDTGLTANGSVFFIGCNTAVDTRHREKHITNALALRLPGRTVFGTDREPPIGMIKFSDGPQVVEGECLRKFTYARVQRTVAPFFAHARL
jgi:hypothetical protein